MGPTNGWTDGQTDGVWGEGGSLIPSGTPGFGSFCFGICGGSIGILGNQGNPRIFEEIQGKSRKSKENPGDSRNSKKIEEIHKFP